MAHDLPRGREQQMTHDHIFVCAADTGVLREEAVFAAACTDTTPQRQEIIKRLRHGSDRQLSLGAELLLRRCLRAQGIASYALTRDAYGKPQLSRCVFTDGHAWSDQAGTSAPPLHLNLSHSGTRVLCALSDRPVGCDVEQIRAANLPLARRFFSPEEYEQLAALPTGAAQDALFFHLWTRKESLMKARGLGVSMLRERLSVAAQCACFGYHLRSYEMQDGYCYAVCGEAAHSDEALRFVSLLD